MSVKNQDLEQILEEPISRRRFFRRSATGLLLLEEAVRNSGCTPAFIGYPVIYPTDVSCPPIRSEYEGSVDIEGNTRRSRHSGVDIVARKGSPVIAAADGVVILAGWVSAGGNRIMIYHGEENGKHIYSRYSHMEELNVKEGVVTLEPVNRGQEIGTVGDTGSAMPPRRTPHLHFEVYALNYSLIQGKKVSSFSSDYTSDPHDFWLRGNNFPPDKIIIPPFIKGREYPSKPIRFTYPVPCR